jgi:CRISPR system Cascade subunit CasD
MQNNTVFLRLEGLLQTWGICSRFKIRETAREPTKSGVVGLLCCAMGLRRQEAEDTGWLNRLNELQMGVRVDRPGWLWQDYHTVGAGYGVLCAGGWIKRTEATGEFEGIESWREYLCDASFVVALRARDGTEDIIERVAQKLDDPIWVPYLGRKCCPPSRPVFLKKDRSDDPELGLPSIEWQARQSGDEMPQEGLRTILEVNAREGVSLPRGAEPRQDVAVRFRPPLHRTRYVIVKSMHPAVASTPHMRLCPQPYRGWPKCKSPIWRNEKRPQRLSLDHKCCVFCGAGPNPGHPVHHVDYSNSPDHEDVQNDLRSLCDLCHSAITMLEYGAGMTEQRIDPLDPRWREPILKKRDEILRDRLPLHLGRKRVLSGGEE